MWIPQNVSGFRILFNAELAYEQLKARSGILISSNAEFKSKDLIIVSGIHEQVLKHWLPKSVDVILSYFEIQHRIDSIFRVIELRVYGNATRSIPPNLVGI